MTIGPTPIRPVIWEPLLFPVLSPVRFLKPCLQVFYRSSSRTSSLLIFQNEESWPAVQQLIWKCKFRLSTGDANSGLQQLVPSMGSDFSSYKLHSRQTSPLAFKNGKQAPLRYRPSPNLSILGGIFIIRIVTLFHAPLERRPSFPRAIGVTTSLSTHNPSH